MNNTNPDPDNTGDDAHETPTRNQTPPRINTPNTPGTTNNANTPSTTNTNHNQDNNPPRRITHLILHTIVNTGETIGTGTGTVTQYFLQKTVVVLEALTALFLLLYPFAAIGAFIDPNSPGFIPVTAMTATLVLTFLVLSVVVDYVSGRNRYA